MGQACGLLSYRRDAGNGLLGIASTCLTNASSHKETKGIFDAGMGLGPMLIPQDPERKAESGATLALSGS